MFFNLSIAGFELFYKIPQIPLGLYAKLLDNRVAYKIVTAQYNGREIFHGMSSRKKGQSYFVRVRVM